MGLISAIITLSLFISTIIAGFCSKFKLANFLAGLTSFTGYLLFLLFH
ncbi:MAG: hypothetical protein RUMPE_00950 [Eubacteriales bacterium SKADARSKE-1]|nr:hypothetical protein [Eubacteriales bacterium SKADARSKE-1]